MKNKTGLIVGVLAVLLVVTGVLVFKVLTAPRTSPTTPGEEMVEEILPPVDESVIVDLIKSTKPDTVVITAKGLGGTMTSVSYELTYESEGLIKGVNSGSKPIETAGKDEFEREVYLGTCSRNVCKPDPGVSKISLVLQFTDDNGKKSQFTGEYEL